MIIFSTKTDYCSEASKLWPAAWLWRGGSEDTRPDGVSVSSSVIFAAPKVPLRAME
jgi:hypothetical protein